jgi:hypothetical protein
VILRAVPAPLNCRRAHRARPRFVHAVFFERTTWLTPIRIRRARVGHAIPPKAGDGVLGPPGKSGALQRRRRKSLTKRKRRELHHRTKAAYWTHCPSPPSDMVPAWSRRWPAESVRSRSTRIKSGIAGTLATSIGLLRQPESVGARGQEVRRRLGRLPSLRRTNYLRRPATIPAITSRSRGVRGA